MNATERKRTTESVSGHIQGWLASWGFLDNPFATWEASREPWLDRYFVRRPFYEQLLTNPTSAFVFAPRGAGKSALRIMLQSECRPQSPSSAVFAAALTDFSAITENLARSKLFTLQDYLPTIFDTAVGNLIESISHLLASGNQLPETDMRELRYWIDEYVSHYLSRRFLPRLLQPHAPQAGRTELRKWAEAVVRGETLAENPRLNALAQVWHCLLKAQPLPPPVPLHSPGMVVAAFVQFVVDLLSVGYGPCTAVYLLVDGIDEYALTQNNPALSAKLLKPLLDLRFLETPHLAVKFFLPSEHRSEIEAVARLDRLENYTLSWEKPDQQDEMRALLRRRIRFFSDGTMQGLGELCAADLRPWIENALLEESGPSPRDLFRLGNTLFLEHCQQPPPPNSELTRDEWERAVQKFRASADRDTLPVVYPAIEEGVSLLYVDEAAGRVFIGQEELHPPLAELEFRLLAYLYQRRDEICSRDDIALAVYPDGAFDGVSDEAISSLVYRLRKKLDPQKQVDYIQTIANWGYRLQHAR